MQSLPYLLGALRLAKFDLSGIKAFSDKSVRAFASFKVAAFTLPAQILLVKWQSMLVVQSLSSGDTPPLPLTFQAMLLVVLGHSIGWLGFLVAMEWVCKYIHRTEMYDRFVIAYNWSQVVLVSGLLIAFALIVSGIMPMALFLAVGIWGICYQIFVMSRILEISVRLACGLFLLDSGISLLVQGLVSVLIR